MKQSVISATELAARWTYAELASPRFADSYVPPADPLRVKAMSGIGFDSLFKEEAERLRVLLEAHDDRGGMYRLLICSSQYVSEVWEYSRLGNLCVAPGLGWARFRDLENGEARTVASEDLQNRLKATACGPFVQRDEPIIVVPCRVKGRAFQLLLEGTFRSLLFARDRDASGRLSVWVPAGEVVIELDEGPTWV